MTSWKHPCPVISGVLACEEKARFYERVHYCRRAPRGPAVPTSRLCVSLTFLCCSPWTEKSLLSASNLKPADVGTLNSAGLRVSALVVGEGNPHWSPMAGLEGATPPEINRRMSKAKGSGQVGATALGGGVQSEPCLDHFLVLLFTDLRDYSR